MPDAVAPPPRHPRFPQIDGLRAIAALSIVVVHSAVLAGGVGVTAIDRLLAHLDIGVAIFFLISGFLLYRPFIAHRGIGPAPPPVGDYAKRRLLRIYPAYLVVLTVLLIVPGVMGTTDARWISQYGLFHTLPLSDAPGCIQLPSECGLAQTWSLAIEMTFYAALPVYALAAAWLTRGRDGRGWMRIELSLLAAIVGVWFVATYVLPDLRVNPWVGGSLIGFMLWFALGMTVAVVSVGFERAGKRPLLIRTAANHPTALWIAALVAYVVFSLWIRPSSETFVILLENRLTNQIGYGVIALLMLSAAVFSKGSRALAPRALTHPVVAWLGLISYGIFLWHYVFVLQFGFPGADWGFAPALLATLTLTIPCAAASYYLVERPVLRLKYRSLHELLGRNRKPATAPAD